MKYKKEGKENRRDEDKNAKRKKKHNERRKN